MFCLHRFAVKPFRKVKVSLFLPLDKPSANRPFASLPSNKTLLTPNAYRSERPCRFCRIPSTDRLFNKTDPEGMKTEYQYNAVGSGSTLKKVIVDQGTGRGVLVLGSTSVSP